MSNEAVVRSSLTIRKGNVQHQTTPQQFTADVATASSGTPGEVTATTGGTTVNLSHLAALGGFMEIQNLDSTNYITVGSWDGVTFRPMDDILPGETYTHRTSRYLLTGMTGTAHLYDLRIIAHTASCKVKVLVFEP